MEMTLLFGLFLLTLAAFGLGPKSQPQRKVIPVRVRAKNSKAYDAAAGNLEKLK